MKALEKRLTNAGCYKDAINEHASTRSMLRSRPAPTSSRTAHRDQHAHHPNPKHRHRRRVLAHGDRVR
jgi:hypothetical protein